MQRRPNCGQRNVCRFCGCGADTWTDADADAARLAMELEALLLSTKDTAAISRWWDSAHDALELHRQRVASAIERAQGSGGSNE